MTTHESPPERFERILQGYTMLDVLRYADRSVPMISIDDSVIKAVVALKALDVPALGLTDQQGQVVGVFVGFNLITLLHKVASTGSEKLWKSLYKVQLYDISWFPLSVKPEETLKDLLSMMLARRWGYAVVRHGGVDRVIGILDVARLLASSGALEKIPIKLSEISTKNVVTIGMDSTIFDLMYVMIRSRVRRVLLREEDRIITDRSILQYLVSDPVLQELRDSPSKVMEQAIDSLLGYAGKPVILGHDITVSVAVGKLVESEPYTVLTEDRKQIFTPLDITKLLKY